jgi:hypothetical protein
MAERLHMTPSPYCTGFRLQSIGMKFAAGVIDVASFADASRVRGMRWRRDEHYDGGGSSQHQSVHGLNPD